MKLLGDTRREGISLQGTPSFSPPLRVSLSGEAILLRAKPSKPAGASEAVSKGLLLLKLFQRFREAFCLLVAGPTRKSSSPSASLPAAALLGVRASQLREEALGRIVSRTAGLSFHTYLNEEFNSPGKARWLA